MDDARAVWQAVPSPQRGEIVRQIGEQLRSEEAFFIVSLSRSSQLCLDSSQSAQPPSLLIPFLCLIHSI